MGRKRTDRLPTPVEAAEGFRLAAENARRLLNSADAVASTQSWGTAAALAVLAFEEAVKSRTLGLIVVAALQDRDLGFGEDEIKKIIFWDHGSRHAAGAIQHIAASLPDLYGRLSLGFELTEDELAQLKKLADLLESANALKQAGFYTDFDQAAGSWATPADTDQVTFQSFRDLADKFVAESERQVRTLLDDAASAVTRFLQSLAATAVRSE